MIADPLPRRPNPPSPRMLGLVWMGEPHANNAHNGRYHHTRTVVHDTQNQGTFNAGRNAQKRRLRESTSP